MHIDRLLLRSDTAIELSLDILILIFRRIFTHQLALPSQAHRF